MASTVIRNVVCHLPARLQVIAQERLLRYADREFRQEAKHLLNIMYRMKMPDDEASLKIKEAQVKTELELRGKYQPDDLEEPLLSEEQQFKMQHITDMIEGKVNERRRDWHYYEYDERASLLYMATRLAPNFTAIKTVLNEIKIRYPEYEPRSVLDFGSGCGTATWAINETWPKQVSEFTNVELSKEQQNLCEYLLRGGKDLGEPLQGVFHRQYLPSSNRATYDMVVVAFSLLELPNRELRAQTIENLWQKTNDLLVIIERGTEGGFTTVNEARNFVLDLSGHDVTKKVNLTLQTKPMPRLVAKEAHVLAPCPHEYACPRLLMPSKKRLNTCRFGLHYVPLEFGEKRSPRMAEEYSYVVLRKGPHPNQIGDSFQFRWPRIVEAPQRRGGHVRHRLCASDGTLNEHILAKTKYDKESYMTAKQCHWGDVLPVKIRDDLEPKNSRLLKSGFPSQQ